MKQIFHPYHIWEDWINGMWRKESREYEEQNLQSIINFTGNHLEYGIAMLRVIGEWKFSSEHNLSNLSVNRQAWIGHAACCIEHGYPEYLVRVAWKELTDKQRFLANNQADIAIKKWEQEQKSKSIYVNGKIDAIQMEFQMNYL
jgi:hypothetical protein